MTIWLSASITARVFACVSAYLHADMPEVMSLHVCLPACRCPRYHQRACRCPRYHQHACRPPGLLTPAMYLILSTSLTVCFSLNQFSFFSSFFSCLPFFSVPFLSFVSPSFLFFLFFSFPSSYLHAKLASCMQAPLACLGTLSYPGGERMRRERGG